MINTTNIILNTLFYAIIFIDVLLQGNGKIISRLKINNKIHINIIRLNNKNGKRIHDRISKEA